MQQPSGLSPAHAWPGRGLPPTILRGRRHRLGAGTDGAADEHDRRHVGTTLHLLFLSALPEEGAGPRSLRRPGAAGLPRTRKTSWGGPARRTAGRRVLRKLLALVIQVPGDPGLGKTVDGQLSRDPRRGVPSVEIYRSGKAARLSHPAQCHAQPLVPRRGRLRRDRDLRRLRQTSRLSWCRRRAHGPVSGASLHHDLSRPRSFTTRGPRTFSPSTTRS